MPIVDQPPQFVADSPLLESAFLLARSAHHGPAREGDTDIDHPLAVAEVLQRNGFDEQVVAAALLHDVVEDTSLDLDSIASEFGPEVCVLVAEMTEDPGIESYPERKAEHRARVSRDRRAAAIYAADKLASARAVPGPGDLPEQQLDHYLRTLEMLSERHPDLPFIGELREELRRIAGDRAQG